MATEVTLRNWSKNDMQPLLFLANNKKIWDHVRDYFPHPYTRTDAIKWINAHSGKPNDLHFVIEADRKFVGAISLLPKDDIYRFSAELGYWIGEPFWGKGIATLAIKKILEICRERRPEIVRVYAEVFSFNHPSMKVLEKNGFYLESVRKKAIVKNNTIGDDQVWVKLF